MKKNRYTEEQIAYALKQAELGTAVPEICRKLGIAEQTFYRWRSKYAGTCKWVASAHSPLGYTVIFTKQGKENKTPLRQDFGSVIEAIISC